MCRAKIFDQLLYGADEAIKSACGLPFIICHGANSVVGTKEVVNSVDNENFVHEELGEGAREAPLIVIGKGRRIDPGS